MSDAVDVSTAGVGLHACSFWNRRVLASLRLLHNDLSMVHDPAEDNACKHGLSC